MRTFLIPLAAAASALAIATPAAAQYYPQPHNYGYGYVAPYGNHQSQQRAAMHQQRINQLQRQIRELDRRNILSRYEAQRLRQQARQVERELHGAATYGLSRREDAVIQGLIARLEQRVYRDARNGNRYGRQYGQNGNYGQYGQYGAYGHDRDRDGRDDRHEDDRGWDDDDD